MTRPKSESLANRVHITNHDGRNGKSRRTTNRHLRAASAGNPHRREVSVIAKTGIGLFRKSLSRYGKTAYLSQPDLTEGRNVEIGEEVAIKLEHHTIDPSLLDEEAEIYRRLAGKLRFPRYTGMEAFMTSLVAVRTPPAEPGGFVSLLRRSILAQDDLNAG